MCKSASDVTWTDNGSDAVVMSSQWTKSTSVNNYVFTDMESSADNFALNKVVNDVMNGNATESRGMMTSMSGETTGSGFAFTSSSENINKIRESGSVTYDGVVTPYVHSQTRTMELESV